MQVAQARGRQSLRPRKPLMATHWRVGRHLGGGVCQHHTGSHQTPSQRVCQLGALPASPGRVLVRFERGESAVCHSGRAVGGSYLLSWVSSKGWRSPQV